MDLIKQYEERLNQFTAERTEKERAMRIIGNIRVVLFILMVYCLIKFMGSSFQTMYWWWCFLGMVPVFAVLVKRHQKHVEAKILLDQLVIINTKELEVIKTNNAQFEDGKEFNDPLHDYCMDLDLFGRNSLFAFVNRTATSVGTAALAQLFKAPLQDVQSIEAQQKAVHALSKKLDFRQSFMANGLITKDTLEDIDYLKEWSDTAPVFSTSPFWKTMRILMPLLSLCALVYFVISLDYTPLMLLCTFNFALLGIKSKYVGTEHTAIGKRQEILNMYISLLNLAKQESFDDSEILAGIKSTATDAQTAFERLSTIVRYFDQRLNILVGLGLNLLILYDVQCLFALEDWKAKHQQFLEKWLDSVAQLDALMSLATFEYNNQELKFPKIIPSDSLYIKATDLGHPLIPKSIRVCNDTVLGGEQRVYVVTGSNMAGKSTFLRCVAINLLLAKCGAPVCASEFECSLMDIMTSMRVQDSISQQTSYFQAELLRLQYIINTLKKGAPTFIILDEILKGTNSEDKLLGSQLLVRHFMEFNCLAMVATHDLELGNMQEELPGKVENLCFESIIENDELSFDYKLNKGIAKNKNATFLMHKMNIVPVQQQ